MKVALPLSQRERDRGFVSPLLSPSGNSRQGSPQTPIAQGDRTSSPASSSQKLPPTSLIMAVRVLSLREDGNENNLHKLIKRTTMWNESANLERFTLSDLIRAKREWFLERKFFDHANICESIDIVSMPSLDPNYKYRNRVRFSGDESSSGVAFDPYSCFFVAMENKTSLRYEIEFCKKEGKRVNDERVYKITSQLIGAIHFMHMFGMNYTLLCPELICIADNGDIKLRDPFYFYMNQWINSAIPQPTAYFEGAKDFELMVPYLAPELFASASNEKNFFKYVNNKCDVWTVGIILLEFVLGNRLPFSLKVETGDCKREDWIEKSKDIYLNIEDFVEYCIYQEQREGDTEVEEDNVTYRTAWKRIQRLDKSFRALIYACLDLKPSERPDMEWLIEQPFFEIISKEKMFHLSYRITKFPNFGNFEEKFQIKPSGKEVVVKPTAGNIIQERQKNLKSKYFEWKKLFDTTVTLFDLFYKRNMDLTLKPFIFRYNSNGFSSSEPKVLNSISKCLIESYLFMPYIFLEEALGTIKQYNFDALGIQGTNESVTTPKEDSMYLSLIHVSGDIGKKRSLYNKENANALSTWTKFSGLISDKDMDFAYQQKRVHTFRKLLLGYPHTKDEIRKEALQDIPPTLRGEIWAALLGVEDDILCESIYKDVLVGIEKNPLSNVTKRQISVDVPRCHQYNPLLNSKIGQEKLKRVLEAWVYFHKSEQLVYWQGLDSLCAPLLVLNFDFEAKTFCSLNQLVRKYTQNFFTSQSNSTAMEERLSIFKKLHMYHDPELAGHLHHISFPPELYAISWFLTLFAHTLPMEKIFKLWDAIILGNSELPIFIATAIMKQMRGKLLEAEFNNAMYLFQNIQGVDIMLALDDAKRIQEKTPSGLTNPYFLKSTSKESPHYIKLDAYNKEYLYPRITKEDFEKSTLSSVSFIVDIRSKREYDEYHEPSAYHISSFKSEETAREATSDEISPSQQVGEHDFSKHLNQLLTELNFKKGLPIVIISNNSDPSQNQSILQTERQLMLEHVPYVSILLDY